MPEVAAAVSSSWGAATAVAAASRSTWRAAAPIQSVGSPFTPADPPPGSIEVEGVGDLTAPLAIEERATYEQLHVVTVTDARTGDPVNVDSLTIGIDDGSVFWTVSGTGDGAMFALFENGAVPVIQVVIDGMTWKFLLDDCTRPRAFASDRVNFSGRSVAAVAADPYQVELNWISDFPTTAAQIASGAQVSTGLEVRWRIEDWLIPAGVLSFAGTPMALLQRVAQAAGAVVTADRSEDAVAISSRYPVPPYRWLCTRPDVQIHYNAVISESYQRADRPAYDAVLLSGQQQGVYGFVRRLSGGGIQAPMQTDPLLTDVAALRQRGASILGAAGPQARVTRAIPVLTGAGEPGVLERGQLVRWVDPEETWVGAVRSVTVTVALPTVTQTVTVERSLAPPPQAAPPLVFQGPIPDQQLPLLELASIDLSPYWSGGVPPYTFSLVNGTLPAGMAVDSPETAIAGTPTAATTHTARIRCVDVEFRQADSNDFAITVGIAARLIAQAKNALGPGPGKFYFSDDLGVTWALVTGAVPPANASFGTGPAVPGWNGSKFLMLPTGLTSTFSSEAGDVWALAGARPTDASVVSLGARGQTLVAVLDTLGARVHRSTDGGATWAASAFNPRPGDICWMGGLVNDRFYFGVDGSLYHSADGVTWVEESLPETTQYVKHLTYVAGLYVLLDIDFGIFYTSPDLETWTQRTHPSAVRSLGRGAVASNGTSAVFVAEDGIWQTSTGTSFTRRLSLANPNQLAWWSGEKFVALLGDQVYHSPDGVFWSLVATAPFAAWEERTANLLQNT